MKDYGNVTYEPESGAVVPNMKDLDHVAGCTKRVSEKVVEILSEKRRVIALGGDHACAIGTLDGHIQALGDQVSLIWVDAHADLNTNATSQSGNIHGMSVAVIAKELADYWPYLPGMDWQKPLLPLSHIGYIGLRSVDKYERVILDRFGITAFGMEDIDRLGISAVLQLILAKVDPLGNRSLQVSFDIDSLDALEAPSTGTPVRGGLALREAVTIVETLNRTGRLNVFDLVEVNPMIGTESDVKKTVAAAITVLMANCGHLRRGPVTMEQEIPKSF